MILVYFLLSFSLCFTVSEAKKKQKNNVNQDDRTNIDVKFFYYRRSNRNGVHLADTRLPNDVNRNLPTYVVMHGMGSNHETWCQRSIRNEILDKYDANIIAPNYTNSSRLYTVFYQEVARRIGTFLQRERIQPSNTIVIGASLGAQIAGLLRRRTGFRPRTIYALDPAGPVFDQLPDAQRLSTNSAEYVQVIHTNAGFWGGKTPLGNDDIYVNGGNDYPCCTSNACKHSGACDLFIRTIQTGPVQGRLCDNLQQARSSSCKGTNYPVGFASSRRSERRIIHLAWSKCATERKSQKKLKKKKQKEALH